MAPKKKALSAPADLAELDELVQRQEAGVLVQIVNMDGRSPLGFGILVAGPDSDRALRAREKMAQSIQSIMLDKEAEEVSEAERAPIELQFLADISIGFVGSATLDKAVLTDTPEDFAKLYRRFRFIRLQVERAHYDRSRFLPESGDGSSTQSAAASGEKDTDPPGTEEEPGTSSGASGNSTETT